MIDDSTAIQKVVQLAFSEFELDISFSHTIAEAAQLVKRKTYDFMILDVGLDRSEDLVAIKEFYQACQKQSQYVLLLLGSLVQKHEPKLKDIGFKQFLKKPFQGSQLLDVVRKLMGEKLQLKMEAEDDKVGEHLSEMPPLPMMQSMQRETRGEKAFPEVDLPPAPITQKIIESINFKEIAKPLEGEIPQHIKNVVEAYCEKYFVKVARDVITEEIRKLAQERSRLFQEN